MPLDTCNLLSAELYSLLYQPSCMLMIAMETLLLTAPRFQASCNDSFYAFLETSEMRRLIIQ
ncbi:MAG: hypothetical protein RLY14_564, partial [Planctomycetota bacterium]